MDTTAIKKHRLYRAYFYGSGSYLLTCGACLLTSNRRGGILDESVTWPGNIEARCMICDQMASAKVENGEGRMERLKLARVKLLEWMNKNTTHPDAAAANRRLYRIEETLRGRI